MNNPLRIAISVLAFVMPLAPSHDLAAYTVPADATPLSAPSPETKPTPLPQLLDPLIVPSPPPDPEPTSPTPPPRPPTAREVALSGVEYSATDYFTIASQSVYTPRPAGMVPFREASGRDCPSPIYSAPGVTAFGWSASGSPPAEFDDCGDRIFALSFFLSPAARRGRPLESLSEAQYSSWQGGVSSDESENLANLVAAASSRALGADHHFLAGYSPIQSTGMPGVAGSVRLSSRRGKERVMEFSAVVTAAGRGEFSTWTVCVVMSEPSRGPVNPTTAAPMLARAYYYLNRDFSAEVAPLSRRGGPFAHRRLR